MGGQQFASDAWLLDMRTLQGVRSFDRERGLIRVDAGITWPELMRYYIVAQQGCEPSWGIRQKQTGADRLTIGGAVAANIHGRGLTYRPFVGDIESLEVVLADGSVVECNRQQRADLFRLVVGGYGLFGVVTAATLRLVPRQKVERVVELGRIEELSEAFDRRIAAGYLYGDFQFSIAPEDRQFLSRGVFSCYRPVEPNRVIPSRQVRLSPSDWRRLLYLAHRNKLRAFNEFADFYLRSSGQLYWSDTHQLSVYLDDKLRDASGGWRRVPAFGALPGRHRFGIQACLPWPVPAAVTVEMSTGCETCAPPGWLIYAAVRMPRCNANFGPTPNQ
jgi:hypothetical protein